MSRATTAQLILEYGSCFTLGEPETQHTLSEKADRSKSAVSRFISLALNLGYLVEGIGFINKSKTYYLTEKGYVFIENYKSYLHFQNIINEVNKELGGSND